MEQALRCCPQCGSQAVDFGRLAGSPCSCAACKWNGGEQELLTVPLGEFDSEQQVLALLGDLRTLISKELGLPLLRFLIKWGFIQAEHNNIAGTLDRRAFSRYLAAIAQGIIKSVLETRRTLEVRHE